MSSGIEANKAADSGLMCCSTHAFCCLKVSSVLNASGYCAIAALSSLMSCFISGINSITPSGISTTPKFSLRFARFITASAIISVICLRVIFFSATSSEIRQIFGWVRSAHSRAMWLANRPISLIKCQYFFAEFASRAMLPIRSEYILVAVSNPKEVSSISYFKSPSMVLGTPIICVAMPCCKKYSDNMAAFVFESSPPIMTTASSSIRFTVAITPATCSGVSIFARPEPIISKPPVFRYRSTISPDISIAFPIINPSGPPKKPNNLEPGFAFFRPSYKPAMTLCPPGACPPDKIVPTLSGFLSICAVPLTKWITGLPYVCGNSGFISSACAMDVVACPFCIAIDSIGSSRIAGKRGVYVYRALCNWDTVIISLPVLAIFI